MSLAGWRPALRVARRDLVRHKGRNALVAVMVGLPVLAVSTFATVYETNDMTSVEQLNQQLGQAQALVTPTGSDPIDQNVDGSNWSTLSEQGSDAGEWTPDKVRTAVGGDLLDITSTSSTMRTERGRLPVHVVAADAGSPQLAGFSTLREGRYPRTDDEVLVSPWVADHGFGVGHTIELLPAGADSADAGRTARVVGTGVVPTVYDDAMVLGLPNAPFAQPSGDDVQHIYLLRGPDPVSWARVRELNKVGLAVTSRSVVQHPPADWQSTLTNPEAFTEYGSSNADRAVLVLVVFSIVLEVILLAGPAFAVGVRRQRRQLALVAAAGGTARDVRRIVLAQALTTGALAAVAGALLGIPLGALIVWAVPRVRPQSVLGPFDVAWLPLLVAAALGAVAALTAAYFPARAAARQDVVAVLAGRRGTVRSRRGLPVLGAVLLGAGAAAALVLGTKQGGEYWVAGGTLVMVLGAIALMPSVVGGIGRLGRHLPLGLRLATRDSARQRGRTAPAVAAVMAAVAGVTTLAIGASSDFAQSRRDYQPRQAAGVTTITADSVDDAWWTAANTTAKQLAPGRELLPVGSLGRTDPGSSWSPSVYVPPKGCPAEPIELASEASQPADDCLNWQTAGLNDRPNSYSSTPSVVADRAALAALGYQLDANQQAVLDAGGVLLPSPALIDSTSHATLMTYDVYYGGTAKTRDLQVHRVRAAALPPMRQGTMLTVVGAIMTPTTAKQLGIAWQQTSAVLSPSANPLSRSAQDKLQESLLGTTRYAEVYTERGFDESFALPLVGLIAVAALAVLVGTLTATGLALVDSRPDAATLAAIGARPRTRRTMAAAQAVVIGLLGSLAGIAVGLVPGIAVAWPLTAQHNDANGNYVWGTPIIAIPWLMLALIGIGVPLLAAAAAGLGVRSRLPLTRRLGQ
ncbi:ABC transporter permease [Angustibacter luteus]|uniref:FtsX-like permease family protein n=1 Tax=Angustibacter luteus TaxID=658456 RepID=A0ABW1JDX3_9ACTN